MTFYKNLSTGKLFRARRSNAWPQFYVCGQRGDRRACLCSALRERSTGMNALATEQGAREKRMRKRERDGGGRHERRMWRRGTDWSDHRYFKLVVCTTLINKKSLNFLRRAERKSGSILFQGSMYPVYTLSVYFFSKRMRHLHSTCNTIWPSLTEIRTLNGWLKFCQARR